MPSRTSEQKTALSIGCTAHIVQDGLGAVVLVLLPVLAQAFGLSYAQVGLYKGLKSLMQAAMEMASGVVTERVGAYYTLVIGLVFSALGYALLAIAPGALVVMAGLLVIGIGTAFQHAPSSALIVAAHPADRRRGPLGLYNSSGDVGKLLFTGAFGLAIGAGLAWQSVSHGYTLVALASALAIGVAARRLSTPRDEAEPSEQSRAANDAANGWGILHWPAYGTLLAAVFLDTMIQTAAMVFIAFLMLSKGVAIELATAATVILLAGGVCGKAACGFLADRLGVHRAFALIQALTAVGLGLVVIAPAWLAIALLAPVGAVLQGSTSITYGFAADLIHPQRMARGYAVLYATASLSSAVGPIAFGVLADRWDIETSILAMAFVSVLAVPLIAVLTARPSTNREAA